MVGSCINPCIIERMPCIERLGYSRDWAKLERKTLHKLVETNLVNVEKLYV